MIKKSLTKKTISHEMRVFRVYIKTTKQNVKFFQKKIKKNLTFALDVTILINPPLMAGNKIFDILREGIK